MGRNTARSPRAGVQQCFTPAHSTLLGFAAFSVSDSEGSFFLPLHHLTHPLSGKKYILGVRELLFLGCGSVLAVPRAVLNEWKSMDGNGIKG